MAQLALAGIVAIAILVGLVLADHMRPKTPIYLRSIALQEPTELQLTIPCSRLFVYEVGLRFSPPVGVQSLGSPVFTGRAKLEIARADPGETTFATGEIRKYFAAVDPPLVDSVALFEIEPKRQLLCRRRQLMIEIDGSQMPLDVSAEIYVSRARRP
ncbi:MAG TPA: hypothetical protein PK205_18290 [Promineifilum sp.]|nr:hypothetical protein [Promineifilum sp.]